MGAFGDLLESVYRSRWGFRTVVGEGIDSAPGRESTHRLWLTRPDRIRWERDSPDGTFTVVIAGDSWRSWNSTSGANSSEREPRTHMDQGPVARLLDPTGLLGVARLEVIGRERTAGRAATLVRARQRQPGSETYWSAWQMGSESLTVAFDDERGVALRIARGSFVTEFTRIAFDTEIPEERFALRFPDGVRADERPEARDVSFDEALGVVKFPVLLPSVLPEGAHLSTCRVSGTEPPDGLFLDYVVDPGARAGMSVAQGPVVLEDPSPWRDWRPHVADGVEMLVREDRQGTWYRSMAVVKRSDTAVEITSGLPLDTVVAVALSLEVRA